MSKNVTVNIHIQNVTLRQPDLEPSGFPLPPPSILHILNLVRERAAQAAAQAETDPLDKSEVEVSDEADVTSYPKAVA